MAILDVRAQIVLARKMTQKVTQEKGDLISNVLIVAEGVTNTRAAGTTRSSKKDRKIKEKVQT